MMKIIHSRWIWNRIRKLYKITKKELDKAEKREDGLIGIKNNIKCIVKKDKDYEIQNNE